MRARLTPIFSSVLFTAFALAGCGPGDLSPDRTTLDYGQLLVGSSKDERVTYTASGDVSLFREEIGGEDSGNFTLAQTDGVPRDLARNDTHNVTIRFAPDAVATFEGRYTPQAIAGNVTDPVSLAGEGVWQFNTGNISIGGAAITGAADALDFGDVVVGQVGGPINFTVRNRGNQARTVTVTGPLPTGIFASAPTHLQRVVIPRRGSTTIRIHFVPPAVGDHAAFMLFHHSNGHRAGIVLKGRGIAPPPEQPDEEPGEDEGQ